MQPSSQQQNGQPESQQQHYHHHQESQSDNEFLEQILSTFPNCSWPPNPHELPSPSSNNNPTQLPNPNPNSTAALKPGDSSPPDAFHNPFDEASLVSKLSQHQMNEVTAKSLLLQHQQQFLFSRRPPGGDPSVQALFNGFGGSLDGGAQLPNQPHFHPPPPPPPQGGSMGGGQGGGINEGAPPTSASTGGSNGAGGAPQRQRVRARRGQATDPHSIAERLRRERIAERMKSLQELVPNANKTDKASMLDEIIDYVKFLQLQVKVLSMSRLGGAAAVAPLVADMNSEEGVGRSNNGAPKPSTNDNSMTVTEHQVAKLMEEDMGSAMQYLQGKGLCLMPISLATAISTATSLSRTPLPPPRPHLNNGGNHHNDNDNNNHHPVLPSIPSSNGEADNNANAPTPD